MTYQSIHKQIIHQYETDRDDARALYNTRKQRLYEAAPEISEIDRQLREFSLSAARGILSGGSPMGLSLGDLASQNSALVAEKARLIKSAGFPEDFLTDIYKCRICSDTGYIGAQKCRCFKQRLIDRYYDASNLRGILERENFSTFRFDFYSGETDPRVGISPQQNIRTVYETCMDFVLNFRREFANLLFYGDTGLGKTFLCNCIAKDLLDVGATVLYVTAPEIFKKFEAFRFNRDEMDGPDDQIAMIYETELLIIDDLGSEFSTVVTGVELFNLINSRILNSRPTIISTNLGLQDFQSAYSDRVISRFVGHYKMLRLFGDDIRIMKKMGGY